MKNLKRITAFVLTLVMLFCTVSFAADPAASIVSPIANSVSTSDSILVSVKLNKACTVRVTVYEQKIKVVEEKISPAAVGTELVSGAAVSKAAIETVTAQALATEAATAVTSYTSVTYKSVDTTSFEAIDLVSNPALETYVDRIYLSPVTYTSTEKIGFYTRQLTGVKPGLYKIKVQVLDEKGNVSETTSSLIAVKEKPAAEEKVVFEQKQSGAIKVIQNLLKSIFK